MQHTYRRTLCASYLGYVVQAIVNNFTPLLFVVFHQQYGIGWESISLLITVNFAMQLVVDFVASRFVDRIGYRKAVLFACTMAAVGLFSLSLLPQIWPARFPALVISVMLCAVGGGLLEVVVSPIVESCPSENKEAHMSLLHSFYCWGHVAVVLLSTAFFAVFGVAYWPLLGCLWALLPVIDIFLFYRAPLASLTADASEEKQAKPGTRRIWLLFAGLMLCAGACELSVGQWASVFTEEGLHVSKTVGDLAGALSFAALMGLSRVLYARISRRVSLFTYMAVSTGLCILGYGMLVWSAWPVLSFVGFAVCGFSVGVMWPGLYSLAAKKLRGGTAMYALLALAGDMGCCTGPTLVGLSADRFGGNLSCGIAAAMVFPVAMGIGLLLLWRASSSENA